MLEAKRITHGLKILAVAAFVALVPVFLIAVNVRWVINAPLLYRYGFARYDIADHTGIEFDDLLSAGRQIRDYFNNDAEFIVIEVPVRGIRMVNLYKEREILHMRDVKALVRGVYRVSEFTGAYLLAFALVGFAVWRRGFLPRLGRFAAMGGGFTLVLAALIGLGSLAGFDRLFLVFHKISFANDLWQLDPRRDYLIAMFPQGFFFDATIFIAGSVIVQALLLAVVPTLLARRTGRASESRSSPEPADSLT